EVELARRTLVYRQTLEEAMDRNRRLMAVRHRPDDVFWSEGRIAAEEYFRPRGLERPLVHLRHMPAVELQTEVVLDPRERVFLPDRKNHVVARQKFFAHDAFGGDAPARVEVVFHDIEPHADQLILLDDERLGRAVHDDFDVLLLGVLQLPIRGFEKGARLARHDLHVGGAETQGGAAAIHGRVADPDDQYALADAAHMLERHRLEPVDADVDVLCGGRRSAPPGQLQVLAFGRAAADEDC